MSKILQFFSLITAGFVMMAWQQAIAGEVEVVAVESNCQQETCRFHVTLRHADEGWDHYADQWQILTLDNKILGTRTLHHPHVNEQPFTRSLGGVKVPAEIEKVKVIGRDSVHGQGIAKVVELRR